MAKKNAMQNLADRDLRDQLSLKYEELRQFRFGSAGSKVRNVKQGSALKKAIARILTEQSYRLHNPRQ